MKQSGRSMVEMLGVLAIIGVLSIGGIAGYTTAMSSYRSNVLLNEINLRAVECETAWAKGEPLSYNEFGLESELGYQFDEPEELLSYDETAAHSTSLGFGIPVTVPANICRRLVGSLSDYDDITISIDNQAATLEKCGNDDSDVRMTFYFWSTDVETTSCDGVVCYNGGTCVLGVCQCPEKYTGVSCDIKKQCTNDYWCERCKVDGQEGYCWKDSTCQPYGEMNCMSVGANWCGERYCKSLGGNPSMYDLLLISDDPLKCKRTREAGNDFTYTWNWQCDNGFVYEGPCPETEEHKGKWRNLNCASIPGDARAYVMTAGGCGVIADLNSGSFHIVENGSGNYWVRIVCNDEVQRVINQ